MRINHTPGVRIPREEEYRGVVVYLRVSELCSIESDPQHLRCYPLGTRGVVIKMSSRVG